MELNFDNISTEITALEILSKISEYDIFKYYCKNFVEIDKSFCSELRNDKHPGCRIFLTYSNQLKYRDFAIGETLDCFQYVMQKFNLHYYEALNVVAADFSIRKSTIDISPRVIAANDEFKLKMANIPKEKSLITIVSQPFTIFDYNYWEQYKIPLEKLEEFDIFSAQYVYLIKGNKRITFEYKKDNPCYAYRFEREGTYSYKIYWPLNSNKKHKWLFSGGAQDDIEGYSQLPLHGDLLILTKSLKDVISFNLLGYNAISLQGEANKLEPEFVIKLLKRFDKIITVYDEDEEGIKGAIRFKNQFGFNYFFIDEWKDLSEFVKNEGIDNAKIMIANKLRNINE